MFDPSSRRLSIIAFLSAITTIFFLAILGFQQWDAARWEKAVRTDIQRAGERASNVSDYLSSLRDIETGQRGYILTADRSYLQPFDRGMEELPQLAGRIRQDALASPEERRLIDELLAAGDARAKRAVENVKMIELGQREEARARIAEGTGKRLMDRARQISSEIEKLETNRSSAKLTQSLAERRERQRKIYIAEVASLLDLAILLFALWQIVKRLRRSSVVLEDAATRQAAIFENATDAMMMLDRNGLIESVNSAAERLFGRDRGSLIGHSNLMLFKNAPSTEVSRAYLERLASGLPANRKQMFDGLRGDGAEIEAEVVTTPIQLADGLHFLAVARDATERRQVERMKDEFVATVSHELRTPLTSVSGSLGLILGGAAGEISEKAGRLVQIAQNNCNRLIRLINDMLDIEKIESGKAPLKLQAVNLSQAITQATGDIASLAEPNSIQLLDASEEADLQVTADPDRLAQVLTNLISNAIKFSPPGGTVSVRAVSEGNERIQVSVTDEGMGIPAEFKSRIFHKFAQADSTDARQKGGTGLGLSIVKELVERMGGSVSFVSTEGEGTTFAFDLPAFMSTAPELSRGTPLGRMESSDEMQILHVDDDPDTLRIVSSAFERRAIVHSSPSLAEAKAATERYDFDAIILDIAMPDGNGLDWIEGLKREDGQTSVPVILYTALDERPAENSGAFARLTKSKASLGRLVRTVENAVKGRAEK